MAYDETSRLWSNTSEVFFRDKAMTVLKQEGPHCVSTCLAMLTGESPETLQKRINTQNPVSWSDALVPYQMKLAYLPTDVRKLKFYVDELVEYEDLFMLCFYTPNDSAEILKDPDVKGWVCSSHVVLLHGAKILDPARGKKEPATEYNRLDCHTKRVFRVVPSTFLHGL